MPWIDAKYYASTQVMDEARHVEVFAKYLDEKLSGHYPVNAHLRMLLDDIIADSRWDMTYLGMQIMIEGLALAAFGFMHSMTPDPLLEAAPPLRDGRRGPPRRLRGAQPAGVLRRSLSAAELRERQEFAFEAAVRMRDRFLQQEVWDRMGVDPKAILPVGPVGPDRNEFQALLFSKIVPNCRKLGLLDAADGWLRTKFTELGVIEFESAVDTSRGVRRHGRGAPDPARTGLIGRTAVGPVRPEPVGRWRQDGTGGAGRTAPARSGPGPAAEPVLLVACDSVSPTDLRCSRTRR